MYLVIWKAERASEEESESVVCLIGAFLKWLQLPQVGQAEEEGDGNSVQILWVEGTPDLSHLLLLPSSLVQGEWQAVLLRLNPTIRCGMWASQSAVSPGVPQHLLPSLLSTWTHHQTCCAISVFVLYQYLCCSLCASQHSARFSQNLPTFLYSWVGIQKSFPKEVFFK